MSATCFLAEVQNELPHSVKALDVGRFKEWIDLDHQKGGTLCMIWIGGGGVRCDLPVDLKDVSKVVWRLDCVHVMWVKWNALSDS